MDPVKIGRSISFLRKKAGLTQSALAEKLFVTDKAVSKWERGIGVPDISILRLLASVLDVDIDLLLEGKIAFSEKDWSGLLILDGFSLSVCGKRYVSDFLLSCFLLVKICDVAVICPPGGEEIMRGRYGEGEGLGMNLTYLSGTEDFSPLTEKIMTVYGSFFLYGAGLTAFLNRCFSHGEDTVTVLGPSGEIPLVFTGSGASFERLLKNGFAPAAVCTEDEGKTVCERLPGGMFYLKTDSAAAVEKAGRFLDMACELSGQDIYEPYAIARKRGLI